MYVPLVHPPGHGQADFGETWAFIGGVKRKVRFFAFDLPQSDASYVRAYPSATADAWVDEHVHAGSFFAWAKSWPVTRAGLNTPSAGGYPHPPIERRASGPSSPAPSLGQNRAVTLNPTACSGTALSLAFSWRRASRESSSEPISPRRRSRTSRQPRL